MMIQDDNSGAVPSVRIALKVVPSSRRDQVVGRLGERLKVKVAAPPEDGAANRAVCRVIAAWAGVSERSVEIIAGHTSSEKTVRVIGTSAAD